MNADPIVTEAEKAQCLYGDFKSTHEALGVLCEEWDELRSAIRANDLASIAMESLQVSAVAFRLHDQCTRALNGEAKPFRKRSSA